MLSELYSFLDASRETVIHWQTEITKRIALGPDHHGQGEHERALWVVDALKEMGLKDIEMVSCPDKRVQSGARPNIIAKLPGKQKKTLWLIAHLDTVPVGDLALWHTDPFSVTVDGDYVIGRGVEDNQQGMVTAMLVAKALLAKNITPELSLGLLFVADEETGMTHGLPHVMAVQPDLIKKDDLVVIPDSGVSTGAMIEVAEKSCLWLRFTVHGKQCHASMPDQGINSLVAASACILALDALHLQFPMRNPLFSPAWSTFVPSKKEANVENINTLPGRDVFYLDCRILPEYNLDDVLTAARAIAQNVANQYGATIEVEIEHSSPAKAATPADAEVVLALSTALKERGITPELQGFGGQTFAVLLRNAGIPAVAWSTLVPNPHVPNERSSISATLADAKTATFMLFPSQQNDRP